MTAKKKKKKKSQRRRADANQVAAYQSELSKLLTTAVDLHRQGHLQQAETLYKTILSVDPTHADALHLLGVMAHQAGRYDLACDLIGQAIESNPRVAHYYFNRGVSFQSLQQHGAAAESYRHAVRLKPDYKEAYENLGVALQDLDDLEGASAAYRRALDLDAESPIAHQNLGTLLNNAGRTEQARGHFSSVLERQPTAAEAHWKKALTLLAEGRYREGWQEYEWRYLADSFVERNPPRVIPFPKWDGSPLAGKTVLINAEQGIGDEIMFASCYPEIISRAAKCLIECDPRLTALFARSFPEATFVDRAKSADFSWSRSIPAIDFRVPAGSLPGFFRTGVADFGSGDPYLRADPLLQQKWRDTLSSFDKPLNIGISWQGGRDPRSSKARSVPLREWQPAFTTPNANFINLQYGDHAEEIAEFHHEHRGVLHSLDGIDPLTDIDEFIALISVLDLVISIDNSTVFMAGAAGTPVWVLLPSSAEWRWLKDRDTSVWHSSARLFRQTRPGIEAWRTVLQDVAEALPKHLQTRSAARAAQTRHNVEARPSRTLDTAMAQFSSGARQNRALLLNDTSSWYHWGCSCTSLAIHEELRKTSDSIESVPIHRIHNLAHLPQTVADFDDDGCFAKFAAAHSDIVARIESADVIYINGEGTLHNVSTQALGLLYLAYIAKRRLHRPVQIINHSCYPDDGAASTDGPGHQLYKKVYREMDFLAVRESVSANLLTAMGLEVTLSFDCLPLFVQRHWPRGQKRAADNRANRSVVIAGSVAWGGVNIVPVIGEFITRMHEAGFQPTVLIGANAYLAGDDSLFVEALQKSFSKCFTLVNATSELQWLDTIARASLLVSGRFHHSIAAAFVDTPFIVMESNTPKIAGLMEMLASKAFVSVSDPNLTSTLYDRAREYIATAGDVLVSDDVKEHLLTLSRKNFSGRC